MWMKKIIRWQLGRSSPLVKAILLVLGDILRPFPKHDEITLQYTNFDEMNTFFLMPDQGDGRSLTLPQLESL